MRFLHVFWGMIAACVLNTCFITPLTAANMDVHARKLNIGEKRTFFPSPSGVGHTGVELDTFILEMRPELSRNAQAGPSSLVANSIPNFIAQNPTYYGARSADLWYQYGAEYAAYMAWLLGADYSYFWVARAPYTYVENGERRAMKGVFRCDTFVEYVLESGGYNVPFYLYPRQLFERLPNQA